MKHSLSGAAAALSLIMVAWHSPAGAVGRCGAKIKATNGTVLVSGRNITGALRWCTSAAPDCSNPQKCQPFFNNSTCVIGGTAKNCVLGDVGTLARITPPDTCTVCLEDDGPNSCGAHVRGCVPGSRALPDISARVFNSSSQSIPSATTAILSFDSERWDTDNIHDTGVTNSRLTCTTPGKYLIFAHFAFESNPIGDRLASILLNGATEIARVKVQATAGAGPTTTDLSVTTHYDLAAGDYVEVVATHTSGGPLAVPASSAYSPEFGMVKLP